MHPTQVVHYLYDMYNRWIGETVDSDGDGDADHMTRFVYDGQQIVLQFESSSPLPLAGEGQGEGGENESPALQLTHRYLWSTSVDQLLADEQIPAAAQGGEGGTITTAGTVLWALTDHLGTVRDLVQYNATSGQTVVVNHRVYDAFGNLESQTNASAECLFGFTGRPSDQASGLQNNLNRWYDPASGRWTSEDPVGFGGRDENLNRYVGNTATGAVDPTGLAQASSFEVRSVGPGPQTKRSPKGSGSILVWWGVALYPNSSMKGTIIDAGGATIVYERNERWTISASGDDALKLSGWSRSWHLDKVVVAAGKITTDKDLVLNGAGGAIKMENGLMAVAYIEPVSFRSHFQVSKGLRRQHLPRAERTNRANIGTHGEVEITLTIRAYVGVPINTNDINGSYPAGTTVASMEKLWDGRLSQAEFVHKPYTYNRPQAWSQETTETQTVHLCVAWDFETRESSVTVTGTAVPSGPQRDGRRPPEPNMTFWVPDSNGEWRPQ